MNILICVTELNYSMGGVSTHILDLCRQFAINEEINKVVVCCDGGELIQELNKIPRITYVELPFVKSKWSFYEIGKLYNALLGVIRRENIDMVHVHSQRILILTWLIRLFHRIPFLWTNHIDAIPNRKLFKVMCLIMRFPIISVSIELRNMMVNQFHCNKNRVYVVNNGIDLDSYIPLSDSEKFCLEKQLDINRKETPYVICLLSRVVPIKGHMILLKAVANLEEKDKIKILFAGHTYEDQQNYKETLIQFAHDNHINVSFLGFSNPRDIFGISDLFVLPSLYEGFALVCIEALVMGCAVIRSDTPGWQEMAEWVEVVEKNNINQLADSIHMEIESGFNAEKTKEGQKAVRIFFSKEKCANATIDVYKSILQNNKIKK